MSNSQLCLAFLLCLGLAYDPLLQAYAVDGEVETWCIAKPSSGPGLLGSAESYACGFVDCSSLHTENPCLSSNLLSTSFAMNAYYQQNHMCDFAGIGIKSITNPGYGDCNSFVTSEVMVPYPAATVLIFTHSLITKKMSLLYSLRFMTITNRL